MQTSEIQTSGPAVGSGHSPSVISDRSLAGQLPGADCLGFHYRERGLSAGKQGQTLQPCDRVYTL